MEQTAARYPGTLRLRTPGGMSKAIEHVARRHHQSASEWTRQLILRGLESEGVPLAQFSKPIEAPPWED
jgi:hypothetical protein